MSAFHFLRTFLLSSDPGTFVDLDYLGTWNTMLNGD